MKMQDCMNYHAIWFMHEVRAVWKTRDQAAAILENHLWKGPRRTADAPEQFIYGGEESATQAATLLLVPGEDRR